MTKKNIRTAGKWAFIICAASVAILNTIKGDLDGIIWPLLAAAFSWAAHTFEEWGEDLEQTAEELIQANRDNAKIVDEIITANHDLAEALKKEQAKNAELQEEISIMRTALEAERKWNA